MIRPLFSKHQRELVAFTNTSYGRDFISQFGGKELKENYPIVKVAPDGIHQQLDEKTFRAVFYPRSPYVKLFADTLTMVDIAKDNGYDSDKKDLVIPHFLGETRLLRNGLPQIYLATGTFNPDADPESTSVDGIVFHDTEAGSGITWASLVAAAGSGAVDSYADTQGWIYLWADTVSSKWKRITRSILLFDTSSLGSVTIEAATLSLYGTLKSDGLSTTPDLNIYSSNPALDTALASGDYDSLGDTPFSTAITYAGFDGGGGYNDWLFNEDGEGAIDLSGITKLGIRNANRDVAVSAPSWSNNAQSYAGGYFADHATNIPKLVITYTIPSGFFAIL